MKRAISHLICAAILGMLLAWFFIGIAVYIEWVTL